MLALPRENGEQGCARREGLGCVVVRPVKVWGARQCSGRGAGMRWAVQSGRGGLHSGAAREGVGCVVQQERG